MRRDRKKMDRETEIMSHMTDNEFQTSASLLLMPEWCQWENQACLQGEYQSTKFNLCHQHYLSLRHLLTAVMPHSATPFFVSFLLQFSTLESGL